MSPEMQKAILEVVRVVESMCPGQTVSVTRANDEEEHVLMIGWKVRQ